MTFKPQSTTGSATSPEETPSLNVLDLPPELRLDIYADIISSFDCLTAVKPEEGRYYLPLLNTCQTFRNEALRSWLTHLRDLRDEAEARYEVAGKESEECIKKIESTFDMYHELSRAANTAYEQYITLDRIFRVDSNTALDHAIEAPYTDEGSSELLDWLQQNTMS